MSRKEHTPISVLRALTAIRNRIGELVKPGLLKRAIGEDAEGKMQYELQPQRKIRRAIVAISRRRNGPRD